MLPLAAKEIAPAAAAVGGGAGGGGAGSGGAGGEAVETDQEALRLLELERAVLGDGGAPRGDAAAAGGVISV